MRTIRILYLADAPQDAGLIRGLLAAGGYGDEIATVQSEAEFRQALADDRYRLILGDYRLPEFDGMTALSIARAIRPDLPFIFVSGERGEELAIAALQAGAVDYILTDNLSRLLPAVANALAQAEAQKARTENEGALRDMAHQWQTTFDAVADAIVIVGDDHRIIRCNKAFLGLTGVGQEQALVGRPCREAIHGLTAPASGECPFTATRHHGARTKTEMRLEEKWVEVITDPFEEGHDRKRRGIVHIIRDITERKRWARQLTMLNFAVNQMRDAVLLIDPAGRFLSVNDGACRIFGYRPDEMLTMSVADIDVAFPQERWPEHWAALKAQGSRIFESYHKTKDGHVFPVEICANHVEYEGQGFHLSLVRDITERKRAESLLRKQEQEFRTLAENCPDMIARYDRDGRFVYANQQLAASLGADSCQLLGKTPAEVYPGHIPTTIHDTVLGVMQTLQCAEHEVQFDNGRTHQIRFSPEFDEQGQVIGALAFGRDVSAIKQAQRILKGQAEAVTSTNTALKVMLNHSRQAEGALQEKILTNIEGLILPYLDQLERLALKDDATAYLRLIRENINTLASSFTKELSTPALGLTPREIQIADLIRKGTSSKEIAALLRLSKGTVDFYRDQIRKKLAVKNKKINLRSYLLSHFSE